MYWVDVIEDIVDLVRADSTKPSVGADAPYYLYGHPRDVVNQLSMKDKHGTLKFKKFPVIILLQDFDETMGESGLIVSETSLNIIIATSTDPNYISSDRYTNTFKPILYPLYELFIEKIATSNYFLEVEQGLVPHTKTDRLFWGTNNANTGNDYLDAIEISDLNLKLSKTKNC